MQSTRPKPLKCRLCRCPRPARQRDGDGVSFCGKCGELRPDDRDELLAFLVVKVDRLGKERVVDTTFAEITWDYAELQQVP